MRKYTSVTAATNANKSRNGVSHSHDDFLPGCNPNPMSLQSSSQIRDPSGHHCLGRMLPPPRPKPDVNSPNLRTAAGDGEVKEFYHGGYVTFNLDAYSGQELKDLKKRLQSELDKVRVVRTRLDQLNSESRPAYPSFQFSGAHSRRPTAVPQLPKPVAGGTKGKQQNRALKGPKSKNIPILGPVVNPSSPSPHELDQKPPTLGYPLQDKVLLSMMRRCKQILVKVMKHRSAVWFNQPVDVVGMQLFDYNQVIKRPMDLGTVKSNLDDGFYKSPVDFAGDVRLTFSNAMTYNPIGHEVHGFAKQLLKLFDDMFEPANKRFDTELRKISWQSQDVGLQPALLDRARVSHLPVVKAVETDVEEVAAAVIEQKQHLRVGKLPKPKAKDPNKRGMNEEERAKLGKELQDLPNEKMDQVVQIVRKRNGELEQDDEEIVLDFEAMDVETLWELDRLVTNYRKSLNKMKRQEHSQLQNQIEENTFITQGSVRSPAMGRNKIVEEEVDIGEESPVGNYPPVEIEKDLNGFGSGKSSSSDSSRSSSSESSSSSDSGPGSKSSSGSDSDEDSVQSPYVEAKDKAAC